MSARRDRLRPLLVIPHDRLAEVRRFYREAIGLEEEFALPADDGRGAYVTLRDGPTRVVLVTPQARPSLPAEPSAGVVLLLETPDARATRSALVARWPKGLDGPGPLQEDGGASFFEVVDPAGHRIWHIQYPPAPEDR